MDLDFYKQFESYSNSELFKIVTTPSSYQQKAVDAATQILAERGIHDMNEGELNPKDPDIIDDDTAQTEDLLTDVLNPEKIEPGKIIIQILILDGIKIVSELYVFYSSMKIYIENSFPSFTIFSIIYVLGILFSFLVFFLFYKGSKWGWLLMFATAIYSVTASVPGVYNLLNNRGSENFILLNALSLILTIINILVIVLCLRQKIKDYYGISVKAIKITIIVALIIPALMVFKKYFLD